MRDLKYFARRFKNLFLDGSDPNRSLADPSSVSSSTDTGDTPTEPFPEFDPSYTGSSRTPSPERDMTNVNTPTESFPEFDPSHTGRSRTPSPERDMIDQFEVETGLRFEECDNFQYNTSQVDSNTVTTSSVSNKNTLQNISPPDSLSSGDTGVPVLTPDSEQGPASSLVPLYTIVDGGSDGSKALATSSSAFALLQFATGSPAAATARSVSVAESAEYENKYTVDDAWNNLKLRGLTDFIRECNRNLIPSERATEMSVVFMSIIQDVCPMTIYDAFDSHMDKLLDTMIANADAYNDLDSEGLLDKARRLKPIWQNMFGEKWFRIDEMRLKDMLEAASTFTDIGFSEGHYLGEDERGGMLRGMSIGVNEAGTGPIFSAPITTLAARRARTVGGTGFKPGEWWPNKTAAARDGVITAGETVVTNNPTYGPTALAMVKGEEVEGPEPNMTQYSVTGIVGDKEINEMRHFLDRRGPFRVLRGHRLRSRFAPKGGIRYDGLYERTQWGYELDPVDNTHKFNIILKRLDNQKPMSLVMQVPRPHHLDEWEVYNQWVAREMVAQAGEEKAAIWRQMEEEQSQEKEEWLQNVAALNNSGFRSYTTVARKASCRQE
ncbi:hypothetical protein BDZ45DRAFT_720527 [Acephala macrosclerotiorum]|nr:hypothetical protein BDZ45DRAFT_720527 [Acephala macrosclerotiorum]